MNINYYTEQEVADLLGVDKTTIAHSYRRRFQTRMISNRWYYDRYEVDLFLENELSGQDIMIAEKQRDNFEFVSVDLNEYLPLCDVLELVDISRQGIYYRLNRGDIKTIEFDGFKLFNKEDAIRLWGKKEEVT